MTLKERFEDFLDMIKIDGKKPDENQRDLLEAGFYFGAANYQHELIHGSEEDVADRGEEMAKEINEYIITRNTK